jgi:tetratricopeptide (TPR) repeat protein
MEFTRAAGASALGTSTFDHLDAVIADLDRAYSHEPPAERFAVARAYRHRVEQLLDGCRTLKQARELYVYAAWLSEILAWLSHDLGAPLTAEVYAIDSFEHADQAGHGELCAWAADAMATIAMYAARPDRAVDASSQGLAKAPARHPVTVRLHAQAARAYAKLGHAEPSRMLLHQAQKLHDRLPARTPARLAHDTGTLATYAMTAYAASSLLWLGDYPQAETLARVAVAAHETTPAPNRAPSREAIARLDLGIALVRQGHVDEAVAAGHQALDCARLVDSVPTRAGELDSVLIGRYSTLSDVLGFHNGYRDLVTATQFSGEEKIERG